MIIYPAAIAGNQGLQVTNNGSPRPFLPAPNKTTGSTESYLPESMFSVDKKGGEIKASVALDGRAV
ncbi:hypothetical protein ACFQVD_05955 [Streptosporangium amethystogenes subsp. fukuiense]|uniref:Uncharacterized protein n=1 Tax=Streptosporangium amethystogenes subsp. fukuiense TaxID=698418 RepID=A0ABW2SV91_9ACTN